MRLLLRPFPFTHLTRTEYLRALVTWVRTERGGNTFNRQTQVKTGVTHIPPEAAATSRSARPGLGAVTLGPTEHVETVFLWSSGLL